jgi:hypothetical protein
MELNATCLPPFNFFRLSDNIHMAKRQKKQDLFKKVLTKALLMYIREQIPHNPVMTGEKEIAGQTRLIPVH